MATLNQRLEALEREYDDSDLSKLSDEELARRINELGALLGWPPIEADANLQELINELQLSINEGE